MLKFTSEEDLASLPPDHHSRPVISDLIRHLITETLSTEYPYDPEADGFIALIEPGDIDHPLIDIWPDSDTTFQDIPWEGIAYQDDHYLAIYLANNQYGIVFAIPDEDWLGDDLTDFLEDHLDPPTNRRTHDNEEDTTQESSTEDEDRQDEITLD